MDVPRPELEPLAVVDGFLVALRDGLHGAERGFGFFSPRARTEWGPPPRFRALLSASQLTALLEHRVADAVEGAREADWARVNVCLLAADGHGAAYDLFLTRQTGGRYHGCWMIDAAERLRP